MKALIHPVGSDREDDKQQICQNQDAWHFTYKVMRADTQLVREDRLLLKMQ
ncbi:MAG: hypothetical protein ACMUJM_07770 [bacterium]